MAPLVTSVRDLLVRMEADADEDNRRALRAAGDRLGEPLRVAFAGRVKAGKSTLLNAIIGADIAASDAAECTRYVTWYRHGPQLAAFAVDSQGDRNRLRFTNDNEIDLSGTPTDSIDRLEVEYPSPMLVTTTLIDTPGIASISEDVSARSTDYLISPSSDQGADVLIYLLRFLHERDANFLEAFTDPSARRNDPLRSLAVLSRADELGAGRGDGFTLARRAADAYRLRPELRGHVGDVMPVSGLLGLHAESLSDSDLTALGEMAALPLPSQERLLLSVERFVGQIVPGVSADERASLIARFGLQGIRTAMAEVRLDPNITLERLRSQLLAVSGVLPLRSVIANRYANRSDVLKASRALDVAYPLIRQGVGGRVAHEEFERIQANAHEIAEIVALREIAQTHVRPEMQQGVQPDVRFWIEAALGADGVSLHQRLQQPEPSAHLGRDASERIDQLRAALNSPAMPRRWQRLIQVGIRSLEFSVHQYDSGH